MSSPLGHHHAEVGTVLEVTAPAGSFTLDTDSDLPLVLISGGVGLTPMVAMLETVLLEQHNRNVTFIHAAKCGEHAMKAHIDALASKYPRLTSYVIYEQPESEDQCHQAGYIDLDFLRKTVDAKADFYFCGPVPFMRAVNSHLKSMEVPSDRIHYEFFGPAGTLED